MQSNDLSENKNVIDRFVFLERILKHPIEKNFLHFNNSKNYFESPEKEKFLFKNGVLDCFISDGDVITDTQKDFYEEIKFPNYDNLDNFGTLIDKSKKRSIFFQKLDNEIPMNSKILEAGCGTGQLSLFLSRFKRIVFSIDLSLGSLELGENFRKKNEINNVYFIRMNLFKLFFPKFFFDVIISNGVLHHTSKPQEAFMELTKYLKKDGYIIIGLYHKYGRVFTNFRQFIIKHLGDRFNFLDKRSIDKNLSSRKKYAWFNDQFKNPKESSHTYNEILNWFNKSGIEFISSIPFSYDNDLIEKNLFTKNKIIDKPKIFFREIIQCISPQQIKEGGFFIMIGKKK